jgi:non-ribosomal peptide synthetase-like protein
MTAELTISPAPQRERSARVSAEVGFCEVLSELMGGGPVDVEGHFFDELGADSLVMAHFCSRVRKRTDLPPVSMKDVYRHSSVRSLAAALVPEAPPAPVERSAPTTTQRRRSPAVNRSSVLCGALQLLIFLEYSLLAAVVGVRVYEWLDRSDGVLDIYLRSVVSGGGVVILFCLILPIAAKWILIGRWKTQEIPVWSLAYVRFWLVKTLVQMNPLVFLFAGSPLFSFYLRALGARVGRGVTIFSLHVPVCTDLLTIGDGTVIRKDSFINGYRAHAGVIQTGTVALGSDVFVGEVTVIDINTSMGDGAQLGHSSALHAGQRVPDGENWHGSPAERTDADYRSVPPRSCGIVRTSLYGVLQLVTLLAVSLPLAIGGMTLLVYKVPSINALLDELLDPQRAVIADRAFYGYALDTSSILFFGALVVGFLLVGTVPRVLNLAFTPDRVYRLYGVHYTLHRTIARLTNVKIYPFFHGDSSYIVPYLRWIGYDLGDVRQTGSNFGQAVKHESPFLTSVGSGTVVADGLSSINADFSDTSFRLSRTSIGANNFLGNRIAYPSQGRTGDNCLLATKVMVPIDGEVRENVGLLGSPPFEIPRTVDRDSGLAVQSDSELRDRLAAKNRHNLITMFLWLLVRWCFVYLVTLVFSLAASFYTSVGALAIAVGNVSVLFVSVIYFVLVERAVGVFQALKPLGCSIYDPDFWRHERFWKLSSVAFLAAFNGTPYKTLIWRMMGARLGRHIFDDGLMATERSFVTIGDECTFNAGTTLQCHSQEDGAFKSDHIIIGAGCTLGVSAFVHYGVTIGDGAVLGADAFLMKGEDMPPGANWGGNPAGPVPGSSHHLAGVEALPGRAGELEPAVVVP